MVMIIPFGSNQPVWVQIPASPLFFSFFLASFRDLNMLDTVRLGTLSLRSMESQRPHSNFYFHLISWGLARNASDSVSVSSYYFGVLCSVFLISMFYTSYIHKKTYKYIYTVSFYLINNLIIKMQGWLLLISVKRN